MVRERIEVPTRGALADFELGGDLRGGDLAPLLEEQEGRHEAVCTHPPILASKVVRMCPVWRARGRLP